jgi:hypothetical protein
MSPEICPAILPIVYSATTSRDRITRNLLEATGSVPSRNPAGIEKRIE